MNTANILDIVTILTLLLATLTCCLKGFVKTIFGVLGTVAALIIAVVVAFLIYKPVYNMYFKDSTTEMAKNFVEQVDTAKLIEDVLRDNGVQGDIDSDELNKAIAADGDMGENVKEYADKNGLKYDKDKDIDKIVDDYVKSPHISDETLEKYNLSRESVETIFKESGDHLKEILKASADNNKEKAASYIEENVLSPIAKRLVRDGLMIVIFILLRVIIAIIIMATGVLKKFELVEKTDKLLGAAVGLISGIITVCIYAYAASAFITITKGGISPLTLDKINDSILFELFFKLFY